MRENIKEDGANLFGDVVFSFNPVSEWQKHADRHMSISFNLPWSHILRDLRRNFGEFQAEEWALSVLSAQLLPWR